MKKINQRLMSVVLVVALLASALGISNVFADDVIDIGNYPALKGFTSGTAPAAKGWTYGIKDYGEKADMQKSDTDFKAPAVTWNADDSTAKFEWAAVDGAASYIVNVYEDVASVYSKTGITDVSFETSQNDTLKEYAGKDLEAQILALDENGAVVSASCIRQFTAAGKPQYKYVLQDFNDETTNKSVGQFYRSATYNLTTDGALRLTLSNDYQFIFFKNDKADKSNATSIVYKIKTDLPLSAPLWLALGTTTETTSSVTNVSYTVTNARNSAWVKAENAGTVTFVSVSDPTKRAEVSTAKISNSQCATVPQDIASDKNGYYMVVPLTLFSTEAQKDYKAGILDVAGFQILSNRSNVYINNTWTASVGGKLAATVNMDFDEYGYITDASSWISQLEDEANSDVADAKTSYAFKGDLGVNEADTFTASTDTLSSSVFGSSSYYKFENGDYARRITFKAYSSFTNKYGANLIFTAENDGYYDLANKFEVVNNSVVKNATVNYRVVKKTADGTNVVYPSVSADEWLGLKVTEDNLNPAGTITAPMVYLKGGEQLVIEAYADIADGGSIEINLGNPTVTPVTCNSTYKGSTYEWSYGNYVSNFVYDGRVGNDSFHQTGRWTERLLHIDSESGTEAYETFPTHNWSWGLNGRNSTPYAGVYYYTAANRGQEMKIETAAGQYGVSFQYTAPMSGSATLSFHSGTSLTKLGSTFKYRVLINGNQVYPASSSWDISNIVSVALDLEAGDVVAFDVIKRDDDTGKNITCVSPKITMNTGNLANSVGDSTFAPLWERPYNNQNYKGEFSHLDGSIWTFNTADFTSTSAVKTYAANYYNSSDKSLYYIDPEGKVNVDSKYIFAAEQLKAKISTAKQGISLTFTAPELGYYDFSTALNILDGTDNAVNGAGNIGIRIQAGGNTIWPADAAWHTAEKVKTGDSIDIEAMEIALDAGDTIVLQVYASSLTKADGDGDNGTADPMIIGFGSPAVQHITTKTFTETGNTTIYTPSDFTVMEDGYSGTYIPVDSRFNITIGGKAPAKTDTATKTMTVDSGNKVVYNDDGSLSLTIQKGKTAAIEYTASMDGSGTYDVTTAEKSGVQYRLLQNGEALSDWASTLPKTTAITAAKGDKFTLEIKATANVTVTVSDFSISLSGLHNNQNAEGDTAYYASFAVPYSNDKYIGKYSETDSGYWKFRLYDANSGEIKSANYYDYTNNKKLYNTDMQNVGYYFVENNNRLTADIYSSDTENYGLSLEFDAPRASTFNFRSGLQLSTSGAEATMMLRLVQETTDDDGKAVTKTIWPAESDSDGWYEETISSGETVTIPYAELTFKEGDTAKLQVYAKDCTAESLRIHLASPGFMEDNVVTIEHTDVGARVYNPDNYKPYAHFVKKGNEYATTNYVEMENRWNYEFIDIDPDTGEIISTLQPDYYRIGSVHEIMYKGLSVDVGDDAPFNFGDRLWLNYNGNGSPKAITKAVSGDKTYYKYVGSSRRFVAPSTASYELNNITPSVSSFIDGGVVRYRIVKVSASTGEQTTVWPTADDATAKWNDGSGNLWEELSNEQPTSMAEVITLDLEVGDELIFQMYNYASKADLDTYLAENSDAKRWAADGAVTPKIVIYDYITDKSIHNLNTGWMADYQLSPYWRIQVADNENSEYRDCTRYSWSYWLDSQHTYAGISSLQKWWFQNYQDSWTDDYNPIISARFTMRNDGYLTTSDTAKFIGTYYIDEAETKAAYVYARILLNGEQIYPETNDWAKITNGVPFTYSIKNLEVHTGDELRYELMYGNGAEPYVSWNPSLTINKYKDVYSSTDDIYNMLTTEMDAHFRALDSTKAFEAANPAAKALSDAIAARKAAAAAIGPDYILLQDNDSDLNNGNSENTYSDGEALEDTEIVTGDSGDYKEWTEEIYTPGGGYRKIIRRYSTAWWVYALIIAACVVAAAGITVLIIILVKKKRKKSEEAKVETGIDPTTDDSADLS